MIPKAQTPHPPARRPRHPLPPGSCDCHAHVFAAPDEFVRAPDCTEDPADGDLATWLARYHMHLDGLGLTRGVVISSIVYREDNSMAEAALAALGQRDFRGIALLRPDTSDELLDALHAAGFRGVRLDFVYPGAMDVPGLKSLAPRLAQRGWHAQLLMKLQLHADRLDELLDGLGVDLVLDHFAYPDLAAGPEGVVFQGLLRHLERGRVWVKLSSIYRQSEPPYDTMAPFVRAMLEANPERILWATNWPHVRYDRPLPDDATALDALYDHAGGSATYAQVLAGNPARLYGFGSPAGS